LKLDQGTGSVDQIVLIFERDDLALQALKNGRIYAVCHYQLCDFMLGIFEALEMIRHVLNFFGQTASMKAKSGA